MLGHYVGDVVIRFDMSAAVHIIGIIIEVPKSPEGLFKIGWSDGSFGDCYGLRDIRRMKNEIEDLMYGITKSW